MKSRMISVLFTIWALSAVTVKAQTKELSILSGIDQGGLVLGAGFDFLDTETESYGGYAQIYSKDGERDQAAIFALGASFTGHVKLGIFNYYVRPGFGVMHHSLNRTEFLLGPSLAYGLSAELDKVLSVGVENTKLYSWIGEYRGLIKDTFLAQVLFKI